MPSIFIWKADKPSTSKKTIRVYSGANWMLEDYEHSSKSFKYLEQIVIPGFNDSVITFNTKLMPQDWIGSELLEVTQVIYELIKSDNYGTLERIGDWMRFSLNKDINYNKNNLESELQRIINWMNIKKEFRPNQNNYNKLNPYNKLNTLQIQQDFQKFLIKFDINNIIPNNSGNQTRPSRNYKNQKNNIKN